MTVHESAHDLARAVATYFREHLPGRTGASRHTVLAYRDAWKLFCGSLRRGPSDRSPNSV